MNKRRIEMQEELAFIIETLTGRLPLDAFNGSWACFSRYCDIQAGTARRAGFADIADVIQAHGNRAKRKDVSYGAAVLSAGAL